jgi:SAM-dependent methyltransferase
MNYLQQKIFNLKRSVPLNFKWAIRKIAYLGTQQYCNVCKSHIRRFMPGGLINPVFEKYEIIGGGYHEYDWCPVCKASYRQRLIHLFLEERKILKPGLRILHAAPEECFHHLFNNGQTEYVCCDIEPERYSYYSKPVFMDLTNITFPDHSFDLVLVSHILEHIPDDAKALSEIYRVMAPGGIAILQVPVSRKLEKTYEDSTIVTPEEKLEKFGQRDHVRIYAMDYVDRIRNAGFQVEVIPATSYSSVKNFNKLMLEMREQLFIARKG